MKFNSLLVLSGLLTHPVMVSSQSTFDPPGLKFVMELRVEIGPAWEVGETAHGVRRIIPIIGGTVEGPDIKGEILSGGADWQIVRHDGVAELEAHYQFRTEDRSVIYVKNTGLRVASAEVAGRVARGEQVSDKEYYFRAAPTFEAPPGKYAWLNDKLFICKGVRNPENVSIQVWQVE